MTVYNSMYAVPNTTLADEHVHEVTEHLLYILEHEME